MDEKFLEQAAALELVRREDALRLNRIRLESPGQSECNDCFAPIPYARRQAVPWATRCVRCQQLFERK